MYRNVIFLCNKLKKYLFMCIYQLSDFIPGFYSYRVKVFNRRWSLSFVFLTKILVLKWNTSFLLSSEITYYYKIKYVRKDFRMIFKFSAKTRWESLMFLSLCKIDYEEINSRASMFFFSFRIRHHFIVWHIRLSEYFALSLSIRTYLYYVCVQEYSYYDGGN